MLTRSSSNRWRIASAALPVTLALLAAAALPTVARAAAPTPEDYLKLADEIDRQLREKVLSIWYPRCIDRERGGFLERFGHDFSPRGEVAKSVVYQARQTWTAAAAVAYDSDLADPYLEYARHGIAGLRKLLYDPQHGGFFWQVNADGSVNPASDHKHAYGISFVIYAGAAVYEQTRDPAALDLAQDAYEWLETHARDRRHGGYHEYLSREGAPAAPAADPNADPRTDSIGTLIGYKSMNTHIHLLEAYTALYHAWEDESLRERLAELHRIVRDRIAVEPGALNMFFTPDWRAIPAHDSIGHDIETGFLLAEAAAALGKPDDPATWRMGRMLVDHGLRWGWDERHGGFYDKAESFRPAYALEKIWWVQAEGLNALTVMHERYGRETDRYWDALLRQWAFIRDHQIDAEHGGWHGRLERDGTLPRRQDKAGPWKAAYHSARAMMHTAAALRRFAEGAE